LALVLAFAHVELRALSSHIHRLGPCRHSKREENRHENINYWKLNFNTSTPVEAKIVRVSPQLPILRSDEPMRDRNTLVCLEVRANKTESGSVSTCDVPHPISVHLAKPHAVMVLAIATPMMISQEERGLNDPHTLPSSRKPGSILPRELQTPCVPDTCENVSFALEGIRTSMDSTSRFFSRRVIIAVLKAERPAPKRYNTDFLRIRPCQFNAHLAPRVVQFPRDAEVKYRVPGAQTIHLSTHRFGC